MVRAKINNIIYLKLDNNKYFHYNDFRIDVDELKFSGVNVKITYDYDDQYFIEFVIPNEKAKLTKQETVANIVGSTTTKTIEYSEYSIEGRMSPGRLSYIEKFQNQGIKGINEALDLWLTNLWEDITITPENRFFKAQKEEIENIKQKLDGIPDEYFSAEEGATLKERLEKMENHLVEKLNNENIDKSDIQQQVNKLHQEIEILKQTIFSLKKKGWFKSLVTKTMSWLSNPDNQKLLKAGKDIIVTMLPDGNNIS